RESESHARRRIAICEQRTGVRGDDELTARVNRCTEIVRAPSCGIEHRLPHGACLRLRKLELDGRAARIAEKQQMAVGCSIRVRERMADEHADRTSIVIVPVRSGELMTVRMPPAHVFVLAIDLASAFQESV